MKKYIRNLLIALDQLVNAILLGDPDETMSSRIGKMIENGKANRAAFVIANIVSDFDEDHFVTSIERDEGKDSIV